MSTSEQLSPLGVVVEHKATKIRYAVSAANFNEKIHQKVRDLRPGESPHSYQPRLSTDKGEARQEVDQATRARLEASATAKTETK